jgi:hypothetical protein
MEYVMCLAVLTNGRANLPAVDDALNTIEQQAYDVSVRIGV